MWGPINRRWARSIGPYGCPRINLVMCILREESYMKQVVGISEIVLWTANKERALQFYRDLIGLEVISPATLANTFLMVGEGNAGIPQMIVLVPKSDEVKAKPFGYQLHHMAFELPEDAFDAQHDAFVAAGYQPRS